MQLAFLGRIEEHQEAALELANFCFETLDVNRLIYVGGDDALDRVVSARLRDSRPPTANALDTSTASDSSATSLSTAEGFWFRVMQCLDASPAVIRARVAEEQRLLSLMRLETVVDDAEVPLIATWQRYRVCAKITPGAVTANPDEIVVWGAGAPAQLPKTSQAPLVLSPGSLSEAGLLVLRLGTEPTVTLDIELFNQSGKRQDHSRLHLWD